MIYPPNHPYNSPSPENDVKALFDVFVSSAHVGYVSHVTLPVPANGKRSETNHFRSLHSLRKPDPDIYKLALKEVNNYAATNPESNVKGPIEAADVVFLDDIGENLKAGKKVGFRTIKVHLGRAYEAVDALEDITGLKLAGYHPKVPIKPVIRKRGARL